MRVLGAYRMGVQMLSRLLVVLYALLLTACATVSPAERAKSCSTTDWTRYGINDGKLGVPASARNGLFENCAEVGQPVDLAAYQAGRDKGLNDYCTAENGYRVGYEGRRYAKVCPPTTEPDFLQGFRRGRRERPAYLLYPRIGIGIGSGGVRTGVGIGVGTFWGNHPGPHTPPYWCGYWFPNCR